MPLEIRFWRQVAQVYLCAHGINWAPVLACVQQINFTTPISVAPIKSLFNSEPTATLLYASGLAPGWRQASYGCNDCNFQDMSRVSGCRDVLPRLPRAGWDARAACAVWREVHFTQSFQLTQHRHNIYIAHTSLGLAEWNQRTVAGRE